VRQCLAENLLMLPADEIPTLPPADEVLFTCPACGETYAVDRSLTGKKVRCRACHRQAEVPSTQARYQLEPKLSVGEFLDLLVRSTLAERRPVKEAGTINAMLANADVIVTARAGELLVGVSRAISDFAFCTYLSDLAVDQAYQRRGIGKELIRRTHEAAGLHTTLILLAAPKARDYYPHIGMTRHDSCWVIPRKPREGDEG
jgi:GNAT superfamily N-acetyltransferase